MNHVFIGDNKELILVTNAPIGKIKELVKIMHNNFDMVEINALVELLQNMDYIATWDNVTAMEVITWNYLSS